MKIWKCMKDLKMHEKENSIWILGKLEKDLTILNGIAKMNKKKMNKLVMYENIECLMAWMRFLD